MTAMNRFPFGIPVLRLCSVAPVSAMASRAIGAVLSGQAAGCFGSATGMNQEIKAGRHRAGRRAM